MDKFERLNWETQQYRNKQVDRFNPSTRANYSSTNFDYMNERTNYHNNRNVNQSNYAYFDPCKTYYA